MTPDERRRARLRAHCEEIGDDDGVDPREYFRTGRPRDKGDRKDRQLCRQAAETLEQVLSGETSDELVGSLHVASVVPAPDASRLLVTLCSTLPAALFDRAEMERRLEQHRARLRAAVAASITRKKAPNLAFCVVDPDMPGAAVEEVRP